VVHGDLVVSLLDCQSRGLGIEISAPPAPPNQLSYDEYTTVHCQWEDETVKERTGHLPSYTEAKKMKSLTLHTHG